MKTQETLKIQQLLDRETYRLRRYGCEEVTVGFQNSGMGNERADYMSIDSRGVVRCYEIKVSKRDLMSKARLSWHGNYNYLVVSKALADEIEDWRELIPDDVGVIVAHTENAYEESIRRSKKRDLTLEEQILLSNSLARSLFNRFQQQKDDGRRQKELEKEIRALDKQVKSLTREVNELAKEKASIKHIVMDGRDDTGREILQKIHDAGL